MYYDRKEIKRAAKEMIRQTTPKPTLVTFAYLMLVSLVSFVLIMLFMVPYFTFLGSLASGYLQPSDALAFVGGLPILLLFVMILLALYSMVMQLGYCKYILNVKRGQPSGYRDLFSGFSRVGRVLMLNLLIVVFTFLWSMLGVVALTVLILVAALIGSNFITGAIMFVGYIAYFVFLMNRTLRYAPSLLIMVDHPELTARECLNESKAIMQGHLWQLFVQELSFIGWTLLVVLIAELIIIPGMFLTGFFADPANAIIPFIIVCIIGFIASAFLSMWVSAYQSIAFAGFYDVINGFDTPAAPVNDFPPVVPTFIPPVSETPAPAQEEPAPAPAAEPEPPVESAGSQPSDQQEAPSEDSSPEL